MNKRLILLIQPLGDLIKPSGYMRTCYLEPLALEYLEANVRRSGFKTRILFGKINADKLVNYIIDEKPFAICFSVYSYCYNLSVELASIAKKQAEKLGYNILTIFGGYHPSALPAQVISNESVDYVICGEGEVALVELLGALIDGKDIGNIKGLFYKSNRHIHSTSCFERIKDLDTLPLPVRRKSILKFTKQYQITFPASSLQKNVAQVMYSRGCSFACEFCTSEVTWGKEVYWRKPQSVVDEIELLHIKYGTNLVYFPDMTFNLNKKKVLELCSELKKRNLDVHWWALFRADLLDYELLDNLSEAKCVKLSLGLESVNNLLSKQIKGNYKYDHEKVINNLNYANKLGLIIRAFLMIGYENETKEGIAEYYNYLYSYCVDDLRITFPTPFPGTKLWHKKIRDHNESRTNWDDYDTEKPVLRHPSITSSEMIELRNEVIAKYYLDERYYEHTKRKISCFPHLKKSWVEYFEFINHGGIFRNHENSFNIFYSRLLKI